jgi:hypothetical protein
MTSRSAKAAKAWGRSESVLREFVKSAKAAKAWGRSESVLREFVKSAKAAKARGRSESVLRVFLKKPAAVSNADFEPIRETCGVSRLHREVCIPVFPHALGHAARFLPMRRG